MRNNPNKCTFGVSSGKFLGYMVSARGIEVNPEKIEAVINMEAPKYIRDIQKLTGRLAALRRFISRSAEKALPFFVVLKGSKNFEWGPECQRAFEEVKKYLTKAPLLMRPDLKETLQLYMAVSDRTLGQFL
ncbi:putative mitochondrial protein AtMg00860 [Apium graveolens]|uniref:putative mitochondrial protein AtMg00860 n=1 Tax=Apium graveolens TaxID=4045 RepID=UPI003D7A69A2